MRTFEGRSGFGSSEYYGESQDEGNGGSGGGGGTSGSRNNRNGGIGSFGVFNRPSGDIVADLGDAARKISSILVADAKEEWKFAKEATHLVGNSLGEFLGDIQNQMRSNY